MTQRHAVQLSADERVARDVEMDAVWASASAGVIQRKEAGGGEHEDGRYGPGAKANVHGRVITVSVVAGPGGAPMTRVGIGVANDGSVEAGMSGYLVAGDQKFGFSVLEVHGRVAWPNTDAPLAAISGNDAVINPNPIPAGVTAPSDEVDPSKIASYPVAKHDIRARVLKTDVVDTAGRVRITIGIGGSRGATEGMKGQLIGAGGRPYVTFFLDQVNERNSTAIVSITLDEVRDHLEVLLNPS